MRLGLQEISCAVNKMKISNIEVMYIDHCGSDISVVNAARVSFHKESNWEYEQDSHDGPGKPKLSEKDTKLINYLAKHEHISPFNHAFLSFRVKAPIFVARQLVKHKFLPWNEVSRRYVDEAPEFYFPDQWRGRSEDKKQGSGDTVVEINKAFDPRNSAAVALMSYNSMLSWGVAPEQARMVLPQNTMTEWIWSGTLGAFCNMLRLRLKPDTQQETREVAQLIYEHVSTLFPVSTKALLSDFSKE